MTTVVPQVIAVNTASARPRWWRVVLAVLAAFMGLSAVSAYWWGPLALAHLDFFHVRRIAISGLRYAPKDELVRALGVDTMQSVWQDMAPLAARVARHPMIASADIERRLPSTLVLHLVERIPVALVRGDGSLRPVDLTGATLPLDPARVQVDAPIVQGADTIVLKLLDGLRVQAPAVYARITEAQRTKSGELRMQLGSVTVRANSEVTVARFLDILPVEADLARNHLRVVELDLRFREQVIARQP